jgi:hypothetical protein
MAMPQTVLSLILVSCLCGGTAADTFVPFVIPAKPNKDSPIAISSIEPIDTNDARLVVRSGHFYCGDERVRLWGVNLSFGANLPKHEDAAYVAARLAAAGVNAVRCHHMDTDRWPRGLWNAEDGKSIAPEALDRLDFFIDQLARHGIFVNINLHVGREHSRYLGLPKPNREYDKICNIFTPALIEAQEQYARELLAHVNRYRKVRYADDPAVAILEITNENSFFMWGSENTLRTLPPYYADILQSKFNVWLKERYGSDKKLREAWAPGTEPLGKNLLTNGDFQESARDLSIPEGWNLEQHLGCKAAVSRQSYKSKKALRIDIGKADETEWHLQLNQRNLSVKAGQYYTVLFEAAGDEPRQIGCGVGQADSPWANLGLSRRVELTPEWQKFHFGFVAKADENNGRLSFSFSGSRIPIHLANVELRPGGRVSLSSNESIADGSIALFADNESPGRTLDRMRFLAETEKAYFDGMRNFIRKELGCGALVTGTIVFGPLGLYAQSDMDFIDAHAYWQHPRFPGRPWDPDNWIIEQKPMTDYPHEATLFRLAAERLDGKPFTVSEYNHPAPLDAQAECVPMIASFAAAQDWDGIWLYTYSHSSDSWDREIMNGYFDIDTNPAKWGFMRAGTAIFCDSGTAKFSSFHIAPLKDYECIGLVGPSDTLTWLATLHIKYDRDIFDIISEWNRITREGILKNQLGVSLTEGFFNHRDVLRDYAELLPNLRWSIKDGKGFYAAVWQDAWVYTGHAERFEEGSDGQLSIANPEFAAVTVTALDKEPVIACDKVLLTACGRCENTGMRFSEDRQTVGTNWGSPPVQIQPVEGTLVLPAGNWIRICHALGPDGMPSDEVHVQREDGKDIIELSAKYKTMWYLLTRIME